MVAERVGIGFRDGDDEVGDVGRRRHEPHHPVRPDLPHLLLRVPAAAVPLPPRSHLEARLPSAVPRLGVFQRKRRPVPLKRLANATSFSLVRRSVFCPFSEDMNEDEEFDQKHNSQME